MNPKDIPLIRYYLNATIGTGYNVAARGMIQALATLGLDATHVRAVPDMVYAAPREALRDNDWLNEYCFGEWPGNDEINIVHLNPGQVGTYHTTCGTTRYNIAVTCWETDSLPKAKYRKPMGINPARGGKRDISSRTVVQDLNDYDEIWVPTEFVKDVFESCGVTAPIYVIPFPLTEELLKVPIPDKRPESIKDINFYHIGYWDARKAAESLLQTWWRTGWDPSSHVRLALQLTAPGRDEENIAAYATLVSESISALKDGVPKDQRFALPKYSPLFVPQSYEWIVERLHGLGHVFVTMSKAEGFCHPAVEAAAMGSYVIGGGGPALDDLLAVAGDGIVQLLPRRKTSITVMPQCKGYEIDQHWWETSPEDMIEAMRGVERFIREGEGGMPAREDVERVREYYSPSTVGKLIGARLNEIAGRL